MIQKIMEFLQGNSVVALIISAVIAFNILITGLKKALEYIKDKTASTVDNKLYDFINKVASVLDKVVEFISANSVKK